MQLDNGNISGFFLEMEQQGLKGRVIIWGLIALLVIAYWLTIKIHLLESLAYTADLFHAVQSSSSYLHGRPLLFNNRFGAEAYHHNFFLQLLFGPLTYYFGAFGLFIIHAGLILLAAVAVARLSAVIPDRIVAEGSVAILFVLLLGPVAFWLWDDPTYGWHVELLFLPLAVLFAVALLRNSRWVWLWGTAIVLTREEGAVLACCVHLLWLLTHHASSQELVGQRAKQLKAIGIKGGRIIFFWLVIFSLGQGLLVYFSDMGGGRLSAAWSLWQTMLSDGLYSGAIWEMCVGALLLLFSGAVLYLFGFRVKILCYFIFCCLPVLVVTFLGSMTYLDAAALQPHGISWAPRFTLFWSLLLTGVLFALHTYNSATVFSPKQNKPKVLKLLLLLIFSIYFQMVTLWTVKGYDFYGRFVSSYDLKESLLPIAKFSQEDIDFLWCVSNSLPAFTPIATSGHLFGIFHKHDLIVPSHVENAWTKPRLYICHKPKLLPYSYACNKALRQSDRDLYQRKRIFRLLVGYDATLADTVKRCSLRN
ncbi:DUF2079 domain-containing protein [Oligoflexia bacterium]|nr:DUF2079 domain-containing protein [Oligoflexia bacterium]